MKVPPANMKVGIAGAGTMGCGIAQVAAAAGHHVMLCDTEIAALDRSIDRVKKSLSRQRNGNALTAAQVDEIASRIDRSDTYTALSGSRLCIEAVVEDLLVKQRVMREMEGIVPADCLIGTNTSSLSVTAIGSVLRKPDRCLGMHFFNPADRMPLVELVRTPVTSEATVREAREILVRWEKTVVTVQDTPGFIVNRVARHFYLEAMRIVEDGMAEPAMIDWAMRELGGFRMGPFELMDLIGNDINYTVTRSLYESFGNAPRFRPSEIQRRLVEAGNLGRKTGRGFYDYNAAAVLPAARRDESLGEYIVRRITLMIINEAASAVDEGIASAEDIDLAMIAGANYPQGPLARADETGLEAVVTQLEIFEKESGDARFHPNALLLRIREAGKRFHEDVGVR
jgi:3-hydroxybutyryl-CoA dehydrogenase